MNSDFDEEYTYDALDRLTETDRNSGTTYDQTWDLDGQGNFSEFTDDGVLQARTVDEANQIKTITGAGNWITPTYDDAGNMVSGPKPDDPTTRIHYTYDAWNRLAAVKEDAVGNPGDTLVEYVYDGLNRRIMKSEDRDNSSAWNRQYYYNLDWQIVEDSEWDNGGLTEVEQYIWSQRYVDTPVVCLHDGNADGDVNDTYATDWRRYYITDAQHNVTTTLRVTNSNTIAGNGVVRNVYTAYGTALRLNDAWEYENVEANFNGPMYAGYFYDTDTGLYQVRNRYYDAGLSTFLNRDPSGYNGGDANLYRYCGNNPVMFVDPSGETSGPHHGYPLHLGGAVNQPVWHFTDPTKHTIAQNYLRSRFPYGEAGRAAWAKLGAAEQRALIAQSLRSAGVESKAIAANMDAIMAGAKPGAKIPRVGAYGKVIPVGTVVCAILIVVTNPSVAQAGEISYDWRDSNDSTKGKVECATFQEVLIVESWWNLRSSVWEGVDPMEFISSTQVSPWVILGEMSAKDAAMFETEPRVIEQDWVLGYTIYNTERVRCRFNGKY